MDTNATNDALEGQGTTFTQEQLQQLMAEYANKRSLPKRGYTKPVKKRTTVVAKRKAQKQARRASR